MAAADNSMKSIAQVEQYSKYLESTSNQINDIFTKLKKRTDEIGQNWSDSQFQQFRQMFDDVILKQAKGIAETLVKLSVYTKKQCEFNRAAQNHKLNL